jgi:DNA-binding CsgD family transcriptional regulator
VPFDAAVWLATDPATGLPTAPTLADGLAGRELDHATCARLWQREFLEPDANLFRDLARAGTPAGALRLATGGRPGRSARFRDLLVPWGFGDELRAVLRADGRPWASVALMREPGRPAFDTREVETVAALSAALGRAAREHARPAAGPAGAPGAPGPGLALFTAGGELLSADDDALAWLEELAPLDESAPEPGPPAGAGGGRVPLLAASAVMRARALAEQGARGAARVHLRSPRSGRWLVCRASCLRDADGRLGDVALTIAPAGASELAPILAQAFGLTARERDVAALICRGAGTAEIAGRLHLSPHTVRGYVKDIFAKVGVTSRGELVATLFAEQHAGELVA